MRPKRVCVIINCMATNSAMVTKKMMNGSTPSVMPKRSKRASLSGPISMVRRSAPNTSTIRFRSTIDSPNVTSSGGSGSLPITRLSSPVCST